MTDRLFVYGTLAPGGPNAHVLADVPGTWTAASVRGRFVHQGWGAELGFPAIELNESDDSVPGFVLTSASLAEHWSRLDEFEGEGYERTMTQARLVDGRLVEAFVYVAKPDNKG